VCVGGQASVCPHLAKLPAPREHGNIACSRGAILSGCNKAIGPYCLASACMGQGSADAGSGGRGDAPQRGKSAPPTILHPSALVVPALLPPTVPALLLHEQQTMPGPGKCGCSKVTQAWCVAHRDAGSKQFTRNTQHLIPHPAHLSDCCRRWIVKH